MFRSKFMMSKPFVTCQTLRCSESVATMARKFATVHLIPINRRSENVAPFFCKVRKKVLCIPISSNIMCSCAWYLLQALFTLTLHSRLPDCQYSMSSVRLSWSGRASSLCTIHGRPVGSIAWSQRRSCCSPRNRSLHDKLLPGAGGVGASQGYAPQTFCAYMRRSSASRALGSAKLAL